MHRRARDVAGRAVTPRSASSSTRCSIAAFSASGLRPLDRRPGASGVRRRCSDTREVLLGDQHVMTLEGGRCPATNIRQRVMARRRHPTADRSSDSPETSTRGQAAGPFAGGTRQRPRDSHRPRGRRSTGGGPAAWRGPRISSVPVMKRMIGVRRPTPAWSGPHCRRLMGRPAAVRNTWTPAVVAPRSAAWLASASRWDGARGCSRSAASFSRSHTVERRRSRSRTRRPRAPSRRAPDSRWKPDQQQLDVRAPAGWRARRRSARGSRCRPAGGWRSCCSEAISGRLRDGVCCRVRPNPRRSREKVMTNSGQTTPRPRPLTRALRRRPRRRS